MRPGLRAVVWVWAVVALALTMRYGVLYALSVPPPPGFEAIEGDVDAASPRLVVAPVVDRSQVHDGERIVWTPVDGNGTRVSTVLFVAGWNASTSGYDVATLNLTNATSATVDNRTWELPATLGNGTGFYVAEGNATPHETGEPLVGVDRIDGIVARVEDGRYLLLSLAVAASAAIVPVVLLVATQRPKRTPEGGVWDPALSPSAPTVPCVDCGRPVGPNATFCIACGAYLRRPPGEKPPG
ncbi:MAG TPA: zinc ribbon domain-containing protein [Candidatus Thermoplasmatota archaeon]|nr:zinc ribbon domain-containing protein [Candidatus Thermoplasmatota archaeon]